MAIYERPTKELMRDFAKDRLVAGQAFGRKDAIDWFASHYPKIKSNTVAMHVEGMSVNSTLRQHHKNIKPGSGHDLFFKLSPRTFRLWDPNSDPAPRYGVESAEAPREENISEPVADEEEEGSEEVASAATFAFERDLKNYLAKNLSVLEAGLTLYQEEGITGIEYPVGGGDL